MEIAHPPASYISSLTSPFLGALTDTTDSHSALATVSHPRSALRETPIQGGVQRLAIPTWLKIYSLLARWFRPTRQEKESRVAGERSPGCMPLDSLWSRLLSSALLSSSA